MKKIIFCFWTGNNKMSLNRKKALDSINISGLKVEFINQSNLNDWVKKDYPLHESYEYLSFIHRADYLRVYFMHHYGGGYTDIKFIHDSWINSWEYLMTSEKFGIGYREIGPKGVALIPSIKYINLLINWKKLLGNGAYIFKPNSEFTQEWMKNTNLLLENKLEELRISPSQIPEDFKGKIIDGKPSTYPLKWSELLGNIFHPLCLKYNQKLLYDLKPPELKDIYDF